MQDSPARFRRRALALAPLLLLTPRAHAAQRRSGRWDEARAWQWARSRGWLVGCNFIPSTAVNQLEMWQPDTFDLPTIDRELGFAKRLGFRSVRVFLHDLPWRQDAVGFLARIDRFLSVAARHGIGSLLVLLDGVWDPNPRVGIQPAPRPGVHNSGWVQSPGAAVLGNVARHGEVEGYVKDVITRFRHDARVHGWDLFNEPDNDNTTSYAAQELPDKHDKALALLEKVYRWAREVGPDQPLTAGPWRDEFRDPDALSPIDRFMFDQADVISFHAYGEADGMRRRIQALRRYGRPLLCTEYMARPACSLEPVLGILRQESVGAYNWGLVAGKTQTHHGWDTWKKADDHEPLMWFHDLLRPDGTPFDAKEAAFLRKITRTAGELWPRARRVPTSMPSAPPP